jgi:hypothetical protein
MRRPLLFNSQSKEAKHNLEDPVETEFSDLHQRPLRLADGKQKTTLISLTSFFSKQGWKRKSCVIWNYGITVNEWWHGCLGGEGAGMKEESMPDQNRQLMSHPKVNMVHLYFFEILKLGCVMWDEFWINGHSLVVPYTCVSLLLMCNTAKIMRNLWQDIPTDAA